jgi:hypothetical protein
MAVLSCSGLVYSFKSMFGIIQFRFSINIYKHNMDTVCWCVVTSSFRLPSINTTNSVNKWKVNKKNEALKPNI